MNSKKYLSAAATLAIVAGLTAAITVFAADNTANPPSNINMPRHPGGGNWGSPMRSLGLGLGRMNHGAPMSGVFGTVSTINGNMITISGRQGFGRANASTDTAFTVDASNAAVMKDNATSTVSSIAVGDTIFAQGTINGTSVSATMVRDGQMRGRGPGNGKTIGKMGKPEQEGNPAQAPFQNIQGNGQPVIAGTISTISGGTLTITNKSNVQYAVDASNAKITQDRNASSTLSNLSAGDSVIIQGTVNGTSVVASTIIDQAKPINATATAATGAENPKKPKNQGFFGTIGQFFSHLFGF